MTNSSPVDQNAPLWEIERDKCLTSALDSLCTVVLLTLETIGERLL